MLPPGGGASAARMAALHAGIPHTSGVNTVNRQCSSGLTAINQVAMEIKTGQIDIGIGMSFALRLVLSDSTSQICETRCRRGIYDPRIWCQSDAFCI